MSKLTLRDKWEELKRRIFSTLFRKHSAFMHKHFKWGMKRDKYRRLKWFIALNKEGNI